LSVGSIALLSSAGGQISVSGPSNNVMNVIVLAANKASWPTGVHDLDLSVSDGVNTLDLFASSTLSVGAAQVARVSLLVVPDTVPRSVAAVLPAALGQAFQALQPTSVAAALAALPDTQLTGLAQAIFSALPVQSGPGAPVSTGQAFINNSGYVVIAQ